MLSDRVVDDWVALLIELDLDVVPERLITCPFLESYALPELSIILVLGVVELLLLVTEELLPETALLSETALLPETALRLLLLDDALPRFAMEEASRLAELLL